MPREVLAVGGVNYETQTSSEGWKRPSTALMDPALNNAARVGPEGGLFVKPIGGVRTAVAHFYEQHAVTAADVLMTPTGTSRQGAAATTTQYQVPAGKTLRIQAVLVSIVAVGTIVASTRVRMRANPAGAVALTSPVQLSFREGLFNTPAAQHTPPTTLVPVPDGLEYAAGTGIGFSVVSTTAASHTVDISLIGYEYDIVPT